MPSVDHNESARQHKYVHSSLQFLQESGRALLLFLDSRLAQPRVCGGIFLVVLLLALVAEIGGALARPFWVDELTTVHVSAIRSLSLLWNAQNTGVEGMPITYNWLNGKISLLPLDPHVAFRLLSILGYLLGMLGVYAFVGKRCGPTLALAAALLLSLSPFETYAVEARSYALVVGLLAIAAALWQRVDERWWLAIPFCFALALAVALHHFAIVALACFGGAELVAAVLYRRIRWRVWASLAVSSIPFLVNLPVLLRLRVVYGGHYWRKPTWHDILTSYSGLEGISASYSLAIIIFVGIAAAAISLDRLSVPKQSQAVSGFSLPEIALSAGFLLYPVFMVILTKVGHGGYTERYAWPVIIGFVFAFIFAFRACTANSHSTWLLCALLLVFFWRDGREAIPGWSDRPSAWDRSQASFAQRLEGLKAGSVRYELAADTPIVIASILEYLPARYYLDSSLSKRFYFLVDAQAAVRFTGVDSADKGMQIFGQVLPLQARVEDASAFIAEHKKFIVWANTNNQSSWLPKFLIEKEFGMELIHEGDRGQMYLAVAP